MGQSWKCVGAGIYRHSSGGLYERPFVAGVRTWRALDARTLQEARVELAKKRSDQARSVLGLASNPYGPRVGMTVAGLVEYYLAKGCPKRNQQARAGKQLEDEKARLAKVAAFFGERSAASVSLADLPLYHAWRVENRARGRGDRITDLELSTLSSAFRCAVRYQAETGILANPLASDRGRFVQAAEVRHARDVMPASGEELHRLASYLFETFESQALGWLCLLQAFTGRRVNELVGLRTDAAGVHVAGFVDRAALYFEARRSHKGARGFIRLHPALRRALAAHKAWKSENWPQSPFYFPGWPDGAGPVEISSLTHALGRAARVMKLPHRTSHGLRAFYVNVLRSTGTSDSEIAFLVGQKSGGRLIVDVYGEALPVRLSFLPRSAKAAWASLGDAKAGNVVRLDSAAAAAG